MYEPDREEHGGAFDDLPKIWNLENMIAGADLGHGKFQFDFDTEEAIEEVLKNQPYHFDYWMLSLARWQPKKSRNYPSEITFWIKVVGVPGDYWGEPTFESIGDAIGKTVEVDLDFGRIKVVLDGFKELVFDTTVEFNGGEFHDWQEEWITLEYEKLFGYCETCYSLCHKTIRCPLTMRSPVAKQPHKIEDNRGHGARARGYRGVVLNGSNDQVDRDRGNIEYYGKGKGKMGEEQGSRWTKVDHKMSYSNHSLSSGEGDGSRHRGSGTASRRMSTQGTYGRGHQERTEGGTRYEEQVQEREEGEIPTGGLQITMANKETRQEAPSSEFQKALLDTQAEPLKVTSQLNEKDLRMEEIKECTEGDKTELTVEGDGMELDTMIGGIEKGTEDLQDLTEELEEVEVLTETITLGGEEQQENLQGGKEKALGDVGKKQATRRNAFVASGTSKMRMVQNMLANPKKNIAKTGTRRGEGFKQAEEKGPHSTLPIPKP